MDNAVMKRRWYFKNRTAFEDFSVLYDDGKFTLVKSDLDGLYSFGLCRDFGSFLGFPVNQSCLTSPQAVKVLDAFIAIDKKYLDDLGEYAAENISRWEAMKKAIGA